MLVLNPEVLPPYYLWLFNLTILILYFEDFANYSLYELRMKLFFKTYRFRDFLDLLLRLMFFWRLFNHYSISIDIFIVDSNLVCFIVRAILFLFLGEWLVSEGYLGPSVANFIAVSIINCIEFAVSCCLNSICWWECAYDLMTVSDYILHFEFREIELLYEVSFTSWMFLEKLALNTFTLRISHNPKSYLIGIIIFYSWNFGFAFCLMYLWNFIYLLLFKWFCSYWLMIGWLWSRPFLKYPLLAVLILIFVVIVKV